MKLNGRAPTWITAMIAIAVIAVASLLLSPHLSAASGTVLTDFEGGTPTGWFTYVGGNSVETVTQVVADSDPLALPDQSGDNEIVASTYDIADFGGFGQDMVPAFGGPQDWRNFPSFDFWFYGTGSGLVYQAEISDNRSDPNSDTSERFDYDFTDDTAGWKFMSIPFTDFTRATDFQPGGAPDDGFTLTEIWAWALVHPQGADTVYFDDFALGQRIVDDFESGVAPGTPCPANALPLGFCTFNGAGSSVVISNTASPPAPALPAVGSPNNVLQIDVDSTAFAGFIHGFSNPPALDTWIPQDWSTNEGISMWFYGTGSGSQLFIDILDNRNPGSTTDDAERYSVPFVDDFTGWQLLEFPFSTFVRKEIGNGAPNDGLNLFEMHGYALGALDTGGPRTYYVDEVGLYGVAEPPAVAVQFSQQNTFIEEGTTGDIGVKLNRSLGPDDPAQVSIDFATERSNAISGEDFTPISGTLTFVNGEPAEQFFQIETFDNTKFSGDKQIVIRLTNPVDVERGALFQGSALIDDNDSFDPKLLDDFEQGAFLWNTGGLVELATQRVAVGDPNERPGQDPVENIGLASFTQAGAAGELVHDFPLGQDWTGTETLDFWFRGTGSSEDVTINLKDNRAPDPGPSGWTLMWADEFDDPVGTPPNPANWAYEIGDTTPDGKNGWGNEELQYYTDDPANAQTDGNGNLVITLDEADGSQECYYGPCEFESARLLTQHKAEFAYGRIESRLQVPTGGDGLWPAFWSLGTDITSNPWPDAGEIDIMEYVSRIPNEIFGTIHGPGYNGGGSFGGIYDFGERVDLGYHTFTVEWQPNLITWYVDGIQYHQAEPDDVPGPWVFEKPFFLLLNFAIGGNFGGAIDPANTYPQEYRVDYVRVYQGPDTAERFEATFTDSSTEWQQVSIPMTDFVRSADQPTGAPDDGLTLSEVWGYGFNLPDPAGGTYQLDLVRRMLVPPPSELMVTNLDDSGAGSLREALETIAVDGSITFSDTLTGGTIALTSGPLTPNGSVTVDASAAPGLTIDGGGTDRVLIVDAGLTVNMKQLTLTNGFAVQLGGGVLNNGALTLDHVAVISNTMTTDAGDFWQGGGGIYNGDGATLNLIDSTVAANLSGWAGGGVYSFLNTVTSIVRSTISGNVATDVGGGLRTLGNVSMVNSTISGNTATAWHGGAMFITDGAATILNSTIIENTAPDGTAGGLMVATFGAPVDVTLQNSIVADNSSYGCQVEGDPAAAVLTSLGNNVITDDSCNSIDSDKVVTDAGLEPLADNTGPTQTHALTTESPALNAASRDGCPETDQRGVPRPQGPACDVGAFELVPTAIDDDEPTAPAGSFFIFVPAVQN